MKKLTVFLLLAFLLTSCSHTYYVVRHAEKASPSPGGTMSTPDDPDLSNEGYKRAEALRETLKDKNIAKIYSTNTKRTRLTADPLSKLTGISIETYGPRPDSAFISKLKGLKTNTLIVGHSNTVDDVVNGLANAKTLSDLADSEYDNLFVVQYKRFLGTRVVFERRKY